MGGGPMSIKWEDRAGIRHITFLDKLRTFIMLAPYTNKIKFKKNIILRRGVEFKLTDNATLVFGENCIINDFALFQLTKPKPTLIVGDNVIIGR